jgi:hypothetical protein
MLNKSKEMTPFKSAQKAGGVTLGAILAVSLLASPAFALGFNDTQGYWAQQGIEKLAGQNILGGYPDGTFRPNGIVNRAEFATVLTKALRPQIAPSGLGSFQDVPSTHWSFPSVEAVKQMGWVGGYPDGTFHPSQAISRTEALVILAKAARLPLPSDVEANQILSQYGDASSVPNWAKPSVAAALQSGISANYPNTMMIRPNDMATRGEVAALADRLLVAMATPAPQVQQWQNSQANLPQMNPNANLPNAGQALQGRISIVPASTKFTGTLSGAVSSEMSRVGDRVELKIDQPLVSQDNSVIVPWGSFMTGSVTEIKAAGRLGENGSMRIRFSEIQTPDGRRIPIQAAVATENGILNGGDNKGRILRALGTTAIGAGSGAALGTAMGPLSGGKVGKGAIYGTAVGAGAGAVAAGLQKGKESVLQSGDKLEVILEAPISLEAPFAPSN